MKVIERPWYSDPEDEGTPEVKEFVRVAMDALDDVDFYTGRQHNTVLINVMAAFGRLLETLVERDILTLSEVNNILSTNISKVGD